MNTYSAHFRLLSTLGHAYCLCFGSYSNIKPSRLKKNFYPPGKDVWILCEGSCIRIKELRFIEFEYGPINRSGSVARYSLRFFGQFFSGLSISWLPTKFNTIIDFSEVALSAALVPGMLIWCQLFKGKLTLSNAYISIHWIAQLLVSLTIIRWMVI